MTESSEIPNPICALGITSVILGSLGLVLFFLPILGLPLASIGFVMGLAGVVARRGRSANARWSVAGMALCGLALLIGLSIDFAPEGNAGSRAVPQLWQTAPNRPYVPPPARPGSRLDQQAAPERSA